MKRLILYLGLVFLFAGCGLMGPSIPLTPEERQAREIRSHCEDVGEVARDKFIAEQVPSLEKKYGGPLGGAVIGGKKSRVKQTAYRECMYRYGYRP